MSIPIAIIGSLYSMHKKSEKFLVEEEGEIYTKRTTEVTWFAIINIFINIMITLYAVNLACQCIHKDKMKYPFMHLFSAIFFSMMYIMYYFLFSKKR